MNVEAYFKTKGSKDPLWLGRGNTWLPYKPEIPEAIINAVGEVKKFIVPQRGSAFVKKAGASINPFELPEELAH